MVARRSARLAAGFAIPAAIIIAALAVSCSFFAANPFPEYIGGMERKIDIGDRIASVLGSATSASYEIADVVAGSDRILILIVPSVTQPTPGEPTSKLLVFSRTLDYLGTVTPQAPLGYVSRPFGLGADGRILAGVTVFDSTTLANYLTLATTGLSGFGFTDGTSTYVLSQPAGETTSFTLTLDTYDNIWSAPASSSLDIVSAANQVGPGYKLVGVRLVGTTVTVTLRDTSDDKLYTVQDALTAITGGTASPLLETTAPTVIDGKDAFVYYTDNDIILRRSSGNFERYTADGSTMTSSITVETGTDVGIVYGFSSDGTYLYRLNPVSGSLSLIRTWW